MSHSEARNFAAEADAHIAGLIEGLPPAEAAQALSALANRAATRLHVLGRAQATALKGQPAWPAWAALQNAARTLVLHTSTSRDLAGRLPSPPGEESQAER